MLAVLPNRASPLKDKLLPTAQEPKALRLDPSCCMERTDKVEDPEILPPTDIVPTNLPLPCVLRPPPMDAPALPIEMLEPNREKFRAERELPKVR